jgi:hypothetical protein
MRWEEYAKISHSKFWFLVVVQVMGVTIELQEVRALIFVTTNFLGIV